MTRNKFYPGEIMSRFRKIKKKRPRRSKTDYLDERIELANEIMFEMWRIDHPDRDLTTDQIKKELEKDDIFLL